MKNKRFIRILRSLSAILKQYIPFLQLSFLIHCDLSHASCLRSSKNRNRCSNILTTCSFLPLPSKIFSKDRMNSGETHTTKRLWNSSGYTIFEIFCFNTSHPIRIIFHISYICNFFCDNKCLFKLDIRKK
jgi:hypothetical protein